MGRKGHSLIEVVVYIAITAIIATIGLMSIQKVREKQALVSTKTNIVSFIRSIQIKSENYSNEELTIEFYLSNKEIKAYLEKKLYKTLKLTSELEYFSNNKNIEEDFNRNTTEEGNFNKGFTIYLVAKNGNIKYKISVYTSNILKYPIINIYKSNTNINKNSDYNNSKYWNEEL